MEPFDLVTLYDLDSKCAHQKLGMVLRIVLGTSHVDLLTVSFGTAKMRGKAKHNIVEHVYLYMTNEVIGGKPWNILTLPSM